MPTPDDPDMTAAELALGLLGGDERAAAMRRLLSEPAFAREVADWRERFGGMFVEWPSAAPDAALEQRIIAALPPVQGSPSATAARPWQWLAGVTSLAAAAMLATIVLRPQVEPSPPRIVVVQPPQPLVALVTPTEGKPFAALYDRHANEVRLAGQVAVPSGRIAELWAIDQAGVPHALGLLEGGNGSRVALGQAGIVAGATLAISIEPLGGSPKAVPTGPVVATGRLTTI